MRGWQHLQAPAVEGAGAKTAAAAKCANTSGSGPTVHNVEAETSASTDGRGTRAKTAVAAASANTSG